jgi:hypothetical protein
MNASIARRIRNAEANLITAIDRQKNGQREGSRFAAQPHRHSTPFYVPERNESRVVAKAAR